MASSLDEILTWTSDQILQAAEDLGVNAESNGVVGIYVEGSFGPPVPISIGGESVIFVGVELNENGDPGRRVIANYGGVVLEAGTSVLPGINVGGGAFGFTGPPERLGGWSAGGRISSGVTAGGSCVHRHGGIGADHA